MFQLIKLEFWKQKKQQTFYLNYRQKAPTCVFSSTLARCSAQNQRQDVMIVFQQGAFLVQPQRPNIGQSLGINQNQK